MKTKGKLKEKKGISLIVLVITIIVIVILAVAVILSIANNNPISNANKAKFQNDVKSMQEQVELIKSKNYTDTLGAGYGTINYSDLNGSEKYPGKFTVKNGELVYTSALTGDELAWAKDLGIGSSAYVLGKNSEDKVTITNGVLSTDWFDMENFASNFPEKLKNETYFEIPEGVKKISDRSFFICDELKEISLPSTLEEIGEEAFFGTGIENIILPENLKTIGNGAFKSTALRDIKLPSNLTSIGEGAFSECVALENVIISEGIKTLSDSLFSKCFSFKSATLPDSLQEIPIDLFYGCTDLTVTISSNLKEKLFKNDSEDQIKMALSGPNSFIDECVIKAVIVK